MKILLKPMFRDVVEIPGVMEFVNSSQFEPQSMDTFMKFSLFFRAHRICYSIFVGGLALLLEILLFYLILYKSPAQFKVFKNIVFLGNLVTLFFNVLCVVLQPMADSKDGNIYLMFDSFFAHLSQPYNCALWMAYEVILLGTIIVLPIQYIYRYFLIVRKVNLSTTQFLIMFAFGMAIVITHCVSGYFVYSYNTLESVQREFGRLLADDPFYAMDVPVFTVLDKKNPTVILHFLSNSTILMGSYIIVIVCSYKILGKLRRCRKNMSRSTREMNFQLNILLFVQAAVPFISLAFPVSLQVILSLFGSSMPNAAVILVLIIELAPIVDALATILIIPSYRDALMFWRPKNPIMIVQQNTVIRRSKSHGWANSIPTTILLKKGSV